ncbi:potassium channel family protein [Ktedonobacter racemifer]|uniref:Ion transport 2 domain protein n=1 Tax=Ktedonobacter racemifer DSM 44963 TaxID=485913 RepID=D6U7G6_KTERA|nr:potassium channel family protein [Ktedonobacter racemifer]EFH79827.1 Ion transport 2 domain protein [Ktedonobacter racemifer DSM 44963]
MHILAIVLGLLLLSIILLDSFETMVLPRRVKRRIKLSHLWHNVLWKCWSLGARAVRSRAWREVYLSYFGPLLLLLTLALWAIGLILAFALIQWGFTDPLRAPETATTFGTYIYLSGTTFFTLGLGDVTPFGTLARILTVAEAGIGFGFLALIIGYVPVVYQAFSRREDQIALLDVHAGSPPTAVSRRIALQ